MCEPTIFLTDELATAPPMLVGVFSTFLKVVLWVFFFIFDLLLN